jgi:hypothetical protein
MTGQPCTDCVAGKCCGQLQGCLTDPQCQSDLGCFAMCTTAGGPIPTCFQQCIHSPKAFPVLQCIVTNCGNGVCF